MLSNSKYTTHLHVHVCLLWEMSSLSEKKASKLKSQSILSYALTRQFRWTQTSVISLLERRLVISLRLYGFYYRCVVLLHKILIVYLILLNHQPNDSVQRLDIKENKTEIVALYYTDTTQRTARPLSKTVSSDWITQHFLRSDSLKTGSITCKMSQLLPG